MGLWDAVFSSRNRPIANSRSNYSDEPEDGDEERTLRPIANDPHLEGWRLWIAYRDSGNAYSERWIRVLRVEPSYLIGHCELRRSQRTFRLDRIIQLSDSRTGEIIENPSEYFEPFFEKVAEGIARSKHDKFSHALAVLDSIGDELKVLSFVAEIDGRFGTKEMEVILRVADILAKERGLSLTKRELSNLKKWIKLQDPDEETLRNALRRIESRSLLTFDELWELVEITCEIDGKVHQKEIEGLSLLRKAMESEFLSTARLI